MSSYLSRLFISSVSCDLTAIRFASAVRRALVVILCLVGGQAIGRLELGVTAAVAAYLTGLLDVGDSIRTTSRTMGSCAFVLALTTTIASLIHGLTFLTLALGILLAFGIGIASGVNSTASTLMFFSTVIAVQYVLLPTSPGAVWQVALATLIGSGAQALAVITAEPFVGEMPERRRTARALAAVADTATRFGTLNTAELAVHNQVTSAALAAAEQYVRKSDLASEKRDHYRQVLQCVEIVRLEVGALATAARLEIETGTDADTTAAIAEIGHALDQAADALTAPRRQRENAVTELDRQIDELQDAYADRQVLPAVRLMLTSMGELDVSVRVVMGHERSRRPGRPPLPLSVGTRLHDAFSLRGDPFRLGVRLVIAVILAEFITRWLGLVHGSWTAVTALGMLRPTPGATLPRIVHRAIGTTVGVSFILGYLWIFGGSFMSMLTAIGLLIFLGYALGRVNYFFLVVAAAPAFVLMLSISGQDPIKLAQARWVDVIVGCLLAIVLAFLIPIWRVKQLPHDAAAYASAVSNYLRTIGRVIAPPSATAAAELGDVRAAARKCRVERQAVKARMDAAFVEPPHRKIDLPMLNTVFARTHGTAESAVAAEALLRHGEQPGKYAMYYLGQAIIDLDAVAAAINHTPALPNGPPEHDKADNSPGEQPQDRTGVSRALRSAARRAHAARQAATSG